MKTPVATGRLVCLSFCAGRSISCVKMWTSCWRAKLSKWLRLQASAAPRPPQRPRVLRRPARCTLLYRASRRDCGICPIKPQCCPKEPSRKIPRDIHEQARDVARSLAGTEGFERSRHERKKIEMRFAHLKRILKLGRLRLRGPRGAQDEFVLAAIAQNLRRFAALVARPPPARALCIA